MASKILINAVDPGECRIAKLNDNQLEEFHLETENREIIQGNIYKGIITRVEPSLQAVFVDYGGERHGFLQQQEIHSDYFQDTEEGNRSLPNLVKRGQELIVQVTKDPIMKKGAMLTTFISLPGRQTVLMPGSLNKGVSRKIEDEEERKRLKDMVGKLEVPEGFGVIIRTAGKDSNKTKITKDISYLMRLWRDINRRVTTEKAPILLYKDQNLSIRAIRDYFTPEVTEILIDDTTVYREVKSFVKIIAPRQAKIVKQYKGEKPIFTKYKLESQIASIYENRVNLKSGGSIVIDQTEALVAIDVNSGKATRKDSIEQTAFQTNVEAAEEIARQLRLRDLGGLIVIDFIDMREQKHKTKVEQTIKLFLKNDKARSKVGKISKFGLLEMSRQRIRPYIGYGNLVSCHYCRGKGMVYSVESLGLAFLRKLSLETLKENLAAVKGRVPPNVASYLLNMKRSELLNLELRRGIALAIEGDASLVPGEFRITFENKNP